ncbi:methionyl-tRNA formyltransferase [Nisaea sediminum]|uniref:methionyl-tRNA formyltransferase n=1 Tax=Nisaea sediminum TaxID=2775867 RepID=UPI0018681928|nr:methionyl-tRNA formyltransferase [Nisaea sediminum]
MSGSAQTAITPYEPLRLAFMGTPDFSVPVLEALVAAGHEIAAVYSQPPRPAGRGKKERKSPVHEAAERHGIPVFTPVSLRNAEEQARFRNLALDAAVVVAYGLILPKEILEAPRLGCINVHASLLPRWRGAAPIQRAILAGDSETGVTIMAMDEGLDTGDMLMAERVPITEETTGETLHDTLSAVGAKLILPALAAIAGGYVEASPQPEDGVTYAEKLTRETGHLDWSKGAEELERTIRALAPWPGAWFELGGERFKVFAGEVLKLGPLSNDPGTVLDGELTVSCAEDALRITRLQRPGKAPMDAADLLRGFDGLAPGTKLG